MEIYAIPVEGKFIIYRPLLRLAFVGNRAMAELALDLARDGAPAYGAVSREHGGGARTEALGFLTTIGFFQPDPPPPPPLGAAYRPTTVVLLLTSRCNLRCTYCYASGGEGPGQDLSPEMARTAIDCVCQNAADLGQNCFDLTFHGGGEPVQAWAVLRGAVDHARSRGVPCRISMVSNGVFAARQREWLLHNLDSFSISFDGRQATQDRQRPFSSGRGSFQAAMRTLRALDAARFPYGIRMTAASPWRGRLYEDVRFICEETSCSAMQVEPAFNTRRGEHQGPDTAESAAFVEAFLEAFEIASQAGRHLTYSGARPWLLTQTFCTAPYSALIVNPAGRVVSCYEVADGNHPLTEMSTVGQLAGSQVVLDDAARQALWRYLEEKRSTCRSCFCYWHCAGDCYTRAFAAARREPGQASARCTMNREITARLLLWYIMRGDGLWRGQGGHAQGAQLMRAF